MQTLEPFELTARETLTLGAAVVSPLIIDQEPLSLELPVCESSHRD